jgi:MFS family permease
MSTGSSDKIDAYVWRISAVVIVGSIMSILDTTIVNVALETLSRELHATISNIQWVVTGYMLSLAAVIPITGWAARRFGAKRVYLVSLVLFTAGSALCGQANSTTELILFRVLQGVGGGMILPIGQLMMAEAAGPQRMGRVMSIVAVPAMLAPILGPTIGGLILDNASWRWIFYVNVPIGVIAVVSAWRILPSVRPGATSKLDVRGLILMATGLPLLTYGLAEIGSTGSFTSTRVVVPILLSVVLIAAFAVHALRIPAPLLNLRLYRRPTFSSASFAMFCLGAALFGGMILLPLYWQNVRHESVLDTGLLTAPQGLGMALVMPLSGKLTDRVGGGPPALFGGMILLPLYWQNVRHESVLDTGLLTAPQGLGMALVMPLSGKLTDRVGGGPPALFGVILTTVTTIPFGLIGAHTSIALLSVAMFARGMGIGFAFMPAMSAAFASLNRSELPDATPQLNVLQRVGGSIGTAVLAVVLQRALTGAHTLSAVADGYGTAFWVSAGMTALAIIPCIILLRAERAARAAGAQDASAGELAEAVAA